MQINNMIKKAIFLYFALIVICTSCDLLGNDCPGKDYKHLPYYAVNGFMLTPHEGLYFSQTVTDTLKPLSIDSFNIKLNSLLIYYAKNTTISKSIFSSAFACSPVEPGNAGTRDIIDSISIRSDKDFDSTHPANSLLNDIFQYELNYTTKASINSMFKTQMPKYSSIFLVKKPLLAQKHTFTFTFYLNNNKKFTNFITLNLNKN